MEWQERCNIIFSYKFFWSHLKWTVYATGYIRDFLKLVDLQNQLNILLAIQKNHHSTLNQLASDFNIASSCVHYILIKAKYYPIRFALFMSYLKRTLIGEINYVSKCKSYAILINLVKEYIISIGKTAFIGYRASPIEDTLSHSKSPESECVLRHIRWKNLGSLFFDGNLTGTTYSEFLRDDVIPKLINLYRMTSNFWGIEYFLSKRWCTSHLCTTFPCLFRWGVNESLDREKGDDWVISQMCLSPLDFF